MIPLLQIAVGLDTARTDACTLLWDINRLGKCRQCCQLSFDPLKPLPCADDRPQREPGAFRRFGDPCFGVVTRDSPPWLTYHFSGFKAA